ncbi:hypothetical protein D3C83_06210 [compost metagenome]
MQVFHRLRHDAVVGGHHEQREINATDAGEHVADEALVARDIDETDQVAVRGGQIGEAEVDRDTARFLLRQAVRIHTGQTLHEQRLAVVDVSCGGNNHAPYPLSDLQLRQLGDKIRFVVEAAQVHDERFVLDAADHRNRQRSECRRGALGE